MEAFIWLDSITNKEGGSDANVNEHCDKAKNRTQNNR